MITNFIEIDGVSFAQNLELLAGNFARNTNCQPRPWERMPPDKGFGQTKLLAQRAHFVFEQFSHWLNQLHIHTLGQATDIVMAFNGNTGAAGERNALNHIRIKRALRQKIRPANRIGLFFKNVNERTTNDFALLLWVADAVQLAKKQLRGIFMHQLDIEMVAEQPDHLFAFAGPHHAGIDIHAGQLLTNRFMQQHRDD